MTPYPAAAMIAAALLSMSAMAADTPSSPAYAPAPGPMVAVTGAATATVQNDRMHASLRAEVESPTAAAGANEVNAKIAQALARAKAVQGVEVRTAGYSTWQINEKGKPVRWHVAQTLALEGSDFAQLATLVTRPTGGRAAAFGHELQRARGHASPYRGGADAAGHQGVADARGTRGREPWLRRLAPGSGDGELG